MSMIGGIEANRKKCGDASVPFAETIFIFNAMNKTETLQAAEVMRRAAEGELVRAFQYGPLGPEYSSWSKGEQMTWDWKGFGYDVLEFPDPPPNSAWHNPANLTATQVGVHEGWRLLLESEMDGGRRWDCEQWFAPSGWGHLSEESRRPTDLYHKIEPAGVYRTKSPLPEVKADPCEEACKHAFPQSWNSSIQTIWKEAWQACEEHYKIP